MSYQAQSWVSEHAPYRYSPELAVLKEIANRADLENGTAFPSLEQLAIDARLSRRATWEALQTLRQDGLIVLDRGGRGRGRRSVWRLVMDVSKWTLSTHTIAMGLEWQRRKRELQERKARTGAQIAPFERRKKVRLASLKGARHDTEKVHSATQRPTASLLNHQENHQRTADSSEKGLQKDAEESREGREVEPHEPGVRDPRVGVLLKDLCARLERARADV